MLGSLIRRCRSSRWVRHSFAPAVVAQPTYAKCSEAEAEGSTDLLAGDLAYGQWLNCDHDGDACESDLGELTS